MHSFLHYLADPFVAAASAVVDHPGYVAAGLGIVSLATGLGEAYLAIDLTEVGSTGAGIDAAATAESTGTAASVLGGVSSVTGLTAGEDLYECLDKNEKIACVGAAISFVAGRYVYSAQAGTC